MTACPFLLIVASVFSQQPELPSFVKQHSRTVMYYYRSPDPTLGPKLLKEFLKPENVSHPWFNGKEHVLLLNGALFGDMVAGKPKLVREFEAAFADTSVNGRRVVIRALFHCGDKDTIPHVAAWLKDEKNAALRDELTALQKHLEDPKRKNVRDRAAREPRDLDFLWANFFITGEYAPISRILDVFDQPAKGNEVMQRVARWSLDSNMQEHPKLVELLKNHLKDRPEASRKVVESMLNPAP